MGPLKHILIVDLSPGYKILETTPLIQLVSEFLNPSGITVLVDASAVMYLDRNPHIGKIISLENKKNYLRPDRLISRLIRLRQHVFDIVIVPDPHKKAAFLSRLLKYKSIYSLDNNLRHLFLKNSLTSTRHKSPSLNKLRLLDFFEIIPESYPNPSFYLSGEERETVDFWLEEQELFNKEPFVCIAPGADFATKRWLPERFAKLSDDLVNLGYNIILIGESSDYESGIKVESLANDKLINSIGLFNVRQTGYLLSHARLLIANDNPSSALAAITGTPTLTIFGSSVRGFEYRFMNGRSKIVENNEITCRPCSTRGRKYCPFGHFRCMRDITVNQVYAPIIELLKSNMY